MKCGMTRVFAGLVLVDANKPGQGRGFARARWSCHQTRNQVISVREGEQVVALILLPAHIDAQPGLHEPLVVVLLFRQRIRFSQRLDGPVCRSACARPEWLPKVRHTLPLRMVSIHRDRPALIFDENLQICI